MSGGLFCGGIRGSALGLGESSAGLSLLCSKGVCGAQD